MLYFESLTCSRCLAVNQPDWQQSLLRIRKRQFAGLNLIMTGDMIMLHMNMDIHRHCTERQHSNVANSSHGVSRRQLKQSVAGQGVLTCRFVWSFLLCCLQATGDTEWDLHQHASAANPPPPPPPPPPRAPFLNVFYCLLAQH